MSRWNTLLAKRPFWYQRDGTNDRLTRNYYAPHEARDPPGSTRTMRKLKKLKKFRF